MDASPIKQHSIFVRMLPTFLRMRVQHRPGVIKILDNISWLFVDKILRMGVGLLMGVWIARYLGPEQFGLLSYALAFTGIFSAIASLGIQEIVVRDIVRNPDEATGILGTAAALQIISGIVAYLIILVAIAYIRNHHGVAQYIVAILGSIMLLEASKIAVFWFESQVQSKYTVWVQNGVFLVFAAVKVVMILNKASLTAFAWATVAEVFLVAVILLTVMDKYGMALKRLKINFHRGKILLRDSWPLMIASGSSMIYMKIDQIMLGQMVGDEAVGIFSAATRISEVWNFIPMVVGASVFPAIIEAKRHSQQLYNNRLQRLCGLMIWLSVLVALPMTFLADPLVVMLFGEFYRKSGTVLAIHIWASIFIFLGVASGRWMLAENRQILILQRSVFGVLVNVALNLFLIPFYGIVGSAISTVVAQFSVGMLFDIIQRETRSIFLMKMRALNPVIIFKP